ncbi:hypothetical protein [Pseudoalteromonas sp. BDTF-M6]|uniref:hypothetical protein n=1 Tax=Pseudoalteromonas sp. BDTF-M6 TaxID=2796132 RepID=UPI001BAF158B|nr:hypothetical protein [Pseudoalteromonas sp. BDTF-M6]MBS3797846.1 hypothetical protein [Pseudoalteromonas sp. BDTF-M6]
MIDALRHALDEIGEIYVEKNAAFKVKVIPFFCAVNIKKDHKREGKLTFYSNQLLEIAMVLLFIMFGATIYNPELGFSHGPVHFAIATLIALHVLIRQIAIESLKARLYAAGALRRDEPQPQGE